MTQQPSSQHPSSQHPSGSEAMSHEHAPLEADGLSLFWRQWPAPPDPRAAFLVVHGLAEHSGRYDGFAGHFRSAGVACYAFDLRGHGRSDGLRVHVDSFDDYRRDVSAALARVKARHPDLPVLLVGHSMGGVIVLRHVLLEPESVSAAIVSSPGLAAHPEVAPSRPVRWVARLLLKVAPRLQVPSGLPAKYVSRDPEVVAAYEADPLVSSTVSSGWYDAMGEAQNEVRQRARELEVPVLLMQSGDDRLVDPAATESWVREAPTRLVTYQRWTGLYHEMFNEPEKDEVFAFAEDWLDSVLRNLDRDPHPTP